MKKFMVGVMVLAVLALAGSAYAASVTVGNSTNVKLSLAFYYTDTSGGEVTKGWWHVEPGGTITATLNADGAKPIYYAAFNKVIYVDESTAKAPQVRGWLSYHKFTYGVTGSEPDDSDTFSSRFFKVPGSGTVNVDRNW